ncbi:piggyBac transposable element-derived protein 3-like isoform X1 [Silurus meridionalis]|uniref:piggyBac transposable element-derived protein 3-like isoform X1 n=1 Tax=Silurus meridionalis TaxID=175797 RepID=UPI001EEAAB44|nr:piggyBac transposable element-derived protein 3-like isoform X1 [Silurus meridionalis]
MTRFWTVMKNLPFHPKKIAISTKSVCILKSETTNLRTFQQAAMMRMWLHHPCLHWKLTPGHSFVSLCSTIHSAYTGDTVQRRVKLQGKWETKTFPCTALVTAYNQHMGGVDLSDQLLQYYTAQHKTMKWYRKIFLHFLDIAATNSFIVHKELYGDVSHKEFMEQLIAELCSVTQKVVPKRTNADHVPVPASELSSDVRNVATAGRKSCVHCKTLHGKHHKTPWKCLACDVYLCLQLNRNCFQEWHRDFA